jgi:aspartate carbamoyltransferase regulatory subunit
MEEGLLVRKIDWGTVIDHIPAWRADRVMRLIDAEQLMRDPEVSVIILKNVPSRKYGRKDVVKLYHHYLSKTDAALVRLIYPTVTVNYIRDWKVEKYSPELPETIEGKEVRALLRVPRRHDRGAGEGAGLRQLLEVRDSGRFADVQQVQPLVSGRRRGADNASRRPEGQEEGEGVRRKMA